MKQLAILLTAFAATLTASAQTAAPEGPIQYYTRTGSFYTLDWDGLCTGTQSGCVGVVFDGNDYYFQNLVQAINNDSWVKGTLSEDGKIVTIPADNVLFETSTWLETPSGEWEQFYGYLRLSMLKFDESQSIVRDAETPIQLSFADNTITLLNTAAEQTMLGAIYDGFTGIAESLNGQWHTGADYNTVLTPFDEQPVTVPFGAVEYDYLFTSIGLYSDEPTSQFVKLYTVGDDVYLKGFYEGDRSMTIQGTRQGDKVHFEAPQFIGIKSGYIYEAIGATYTKSEPDEWGWADASYEDMGAFDLTYDEATGTYAIAKGQGIRVTERDNYYVNQAMYCDLTLVPYVDKLLTPSEPTIEDVDDYWELEGDWGIFFSYPKTSVEGEPLNEEHLSYCFYINDELYTFDAARYGLEEDLVEIPVTLSGNEYLNRVGYFGTMNYIQEQVIWKVGVQMIYRVGDSECRSTINEYVCGEAPVGISNVNAQCQDAPRYDIQGRRVGDQHHGLTIVNGRKFIQ